MHEFKYTLETVSLLFLAGANPRQAAELRLLIFRSALLSWWHAALDGIISDSDLTQLHHLKNQIFGAAGAQDGASAIRLLLRLLTGVYLHCQYKTRQLAKRSLQGLASNHSELGKGGRLHLHWLGREEKGNANLLG